MVQVNLIRKPKSNFVLCAARYEAIFGKLDLYGLFCCDYVRDITTLHSPGLSVMNATKVYEV